MLSSTAALIVVAILLAVMLASSLPVALALLVAGTVGIILLDGVSVTSAVLTSTPFTSSAQFLLVVIPLFVLMGMFAARSGIAGDAFAFSRHITRRVPGSLAVASVMACAGFAAVSGSSIAAVATIGKIAYREMSAAGYRSSFAAGIVGAAGTLGVLIPPSIVLVVYGGLVGESIGALLLAGVIPGILSAVVYVLGIIFYVRRDPSLAGMDYGGATLTAESSSRGWSGAAWVAFLFVAVIGGLFGGLFTATEASAVGAVLAAAALVVRARRSGRLLRENFSSALRDTLAQTGFIFALILGSSVFTYFLVSGGLPGQISRSVVDMAAPRWVIILIIIAVLIAMGTFLEPLSVMLIVLPIVYPAVIELGYDGIWLGIITVKAIEIGLITPPLGINVYTVAGVTGVPLETAFQGVRWFLPLDFLVLGAIVVFPELATFLPNLWS